jgi:hypothetical protein
VIEPPFVIKTTSTVGNTIGLFSKGPRFPPNPSLYNVGIASQLTKSARFSID